MLPTSSWYSSTKIWFLDPWNFALRPFLQEAYLFKGDAFGQDDVFVLLYQA